MKQKLVIALFFSLLGFTINVHAQTDKQSGDALKAQLLRRLAESKNQQTNQRVIAVQDSKYNHKENEILAKINSDAIPEDFPVYKAEYSDDQYTILMNKWYSSHPALLRKETTNEQK